MKFLQEVTEWDVPNHIYILNDSRDKMYGYIRRGTVRVETVNKPYRFSTSGRKFKEVANTFGYVREEAEAVPGKEYRVPGSANNVYVVREHLGEWTCTCPAAKWQKGECKHVRQIRLEI
jgi:hypothetical protein